MTAELIVLIGISDATRGLLDGAHKLPQSRRKEFSTVEEYVRRGGVEGAACMLVECDPEEWTGDEFRDTLREASNCPIVMIANESSEEQSMPTGVMTVLGHPTAETILTAIDHTQQLHRQDAEETEMEHMKARLSKLSDPEWSVLTLILQGKSNRSIANQLELSVRTIEARRHRIFKKTETASLPELIILATRVQYEHGSGF